ncbi:thiamine monophosphate synthase [Bradyrhizobium sp. AZCC 2262]|uniref:DUF7793 family protein n=1 Tax=Bradyrhizobium sp. AZCC 2262 TaxID=3117022 RepID=UPI002FF429B2
MDIEVQETTIGVIVFKIEDGILFFSFTPNAIYEEDNSKRVIANLRELIGDVKIPVFVDGTNLLSMSAGARTYHTSSEGTHNIKATAILANSLMAKVTATLYMGLNKPPQPTRVFTDKQEAFAWLQQYK